MHGDEVLTSVGTILCLYRNISTLNRNVNYREEVNIQGIFWFDSSTPVGEGDIIGYNSQLYRLEQVVTAKELLTSDAVHFYKCSASLYRAIS
jgi:hypothetical protein